MCRSVPQIPHAATSTTTSRGPGVGSSTVSIATLPADLMTRPLSLDRAQGQALHELVLGGEAGDEHRQRDDRRRPRTAGPGTGPGWYEADQEHRRGLRLDAVSTRANSSSFQLKMKQISEVAAMPGTVIGTIDLAQLLDHPGAVDLRPPR